MFLRLSLTILFSLMTAFSAFMLYSAVRDWKILAEGAGGKRAMSTWAALNLVALACSLVGAIFVWRSIAVGAIVGFVPFVLLGGAISRGKLTAKYYAGRQRVSGS